MSDPTASPAPLAPIDKPAVIAHELKLAASGVSKTVALLTEGATVPFIARYRKEVTGGLDEVQIQAIKDRHEALVDLEARRKTILESIASQGKLTDGLRDRIGSTLSRTELEDLYLPYKPKRRTRAMIARERGLEPLADAIWAQEPAMPNAPSRSAVAAAFVAPDKDVPDVEAAWQGARDIVAERISDDADARAVLRTLMLAEGVVRAAATGDGNEPERLKYKDYFDYAEPAAKLPSHRVLAIRRGEKEGFLRLTLEVDRDACLSRLRRAIVRNPAAAWADELERALVDAYDRLLAPSLEVDVRLALKQRADAEAIRVFADNLRHLLLASPLGTKRVLALDPGFRTGCKVVVLSETGALLAHEVIYPHEPQRQVDAARRTVVALAAKHAVQAVAIGNGTAGRETEAFVRALKKDGALPADCVVVTVNESGASVYSASDIAREELPDQDITVRGAVSIGRRLQDPLAELVKIDPKSIGVGQYQHDVAQPELGKALDEVVQSCVNRVGVDVNTASPKLLGYVSGIGPLLARNIAEFRTQNGPFRSRRELQKVPRFGPKAFEQAAGFLRVRDGDNPLDASAVHPESYDVVERMAKDIGLAVNALVGRPEVLRRIDVHRYVDERRGEPTLRDIVGELEKPGRDPRQAFEAAQFREDVTEIAHLQPGMVLEGVVTNVAAFGAFVDVGVHQDGLVHISELADRFVKDPAEIVKVGDRVKVRVLSVDKDRKRISLSCKQGTPIARPEPPTGGGRGGGGRGGGGQSTRDPQPPAPRTPFNGIRFR